MHTKHLQLARELRSAGFWTALIAAVVLVLNQVMDWGFNQATIYSIAGTAVSLLVSLHLVAAAHVKAASTSERTATDAGVLSAIAGAIEGIIHKLPGSEGPAGAEGATEAAKASAGDKPAS